MQRSSRKGMSNYEEAVKSLARAPVGCTTTLVFDKPATFTIYIETKGKLSELSGDCDASGGSYEPSGRQASEGLDDVARQQRRGGRPAAWRHRAEYDVAGYVGPAVRTMEI